MQNRCPLPRGANAWWFVWALSLPLLGSLLAPLNAHAQLTKIFVASFGNDANDGSRGAPKRNFQAAHNAVAAGGQIVVLDTAGYGALTITKSLAVTVPPGVNGFVTVTGGSNGITVNAGASDVVSLRGLVIEGGGNTGVNGFGVQGSSVGTLIVEDCAIRNFNIGILVNQNVTGRLQVHGGSIRGNSLGIEMLSLAAVALNGLVTGCLLENNTDTALQTVANNGGTVRLSAVDCVFSGNNIVFRPAGSGANAVIYADNCRAHDNAKVVDLSAGGQAFTLSNNAFTNNGSNDAFSGAVPQR